MIRGSGSAPTSYFPRIELSVGAPPEARMENFGSTPIRSMRIDDSRIWIRSHNVADQRLEFVGAPPEARMQNFSSTPISSNQVDED
jgi:hypothetical protein